MENRWLVTNEIRSKFLPILQNYLSKMESLTEANMERMEDKDFGIVFSDTGINPYQLQTLLEELGYELIDNERNGWELDFWIDMERSDLKEFPSGCERLVIYGCGMTFELKLTVKGKNA